MFIKHGDGKIVSIIEEDKLTDNQKKSVEDVNEDVKLENSVKLSENNLSLKNKNLGDN
jgi:hypothetical protein